MSRPGQSVRRYWLGGKRRRSQDLWFEEALDEGLWQPGNPNRWDTCWFTGMPARSVFRKIRNGRSVNHFPGNNCLTVKSRLWHTVQAYRRRLETHLGSSHSALQRLDFLPRTWDLASDYHEFQQAAAAETDTLWISKPKASARGQGIGLVTDPAAVPTGDQWLVQEYLHRPHLIQGRKYVLRLYVLITSLDPLRVYVYDQGFAKLASARFDLTDLDNLYRHLTNPDVNAQNTGAEDPVVFIDFDRYRQWLREQGEADHRLFDRLDDMIRLTTLAARDTMLQRTRDSGADPNGCYELLGMDCMVDTDLRPWLLECNLSPSLGVAARPEDGGDREAEIKRALVHDLVRLVGLNEPASSGSAGNRAVLEESDAEYERRGHFRRLMPYPEAAEDPAFLAPPRWSDRALAEHIGGSWPDCRFRPHEVRELVEDGRLFLHHAKDDSLHEPNPTAAYIWLRASQGVDSESIIKELHERTGADLPPDGLDQIGRDVHDTLADWSLKGLLIPFRADAPSGGSPTRPDQASKRPSQTAFSLVLGSKRLRVVTDCPVAADRLAPLLWPLQDPEQGKTDPKESVLSILRSRWGYALSVNHQLHQTDLCLADLGSHLIQKLLVSASEPGKVAIRGWLVPLSEAANGSTPAVLVLPGVDPLGQQFAQDLAAANGCGFHGGALLDPDSGDARALALPVLQAGEMKTVHCLPWRSRDTTRCHAPAQPGEPSGTLLDIRSVLLPGREPSGERKWPSQAAALARLLPDDLTAEDGHQAADAFIEWLAIAMPLIRRVPPEQSEEIARELQATADRPAEGTANT